MQRPAKFRTNLCGNAAALAIAFVSLLLRPGNPADAALSSGLILSIVTVGILPITGWMGDELAYRFKIGMID